MDLTNRAAIVGGALLSIFLILVILIMAWGAPDESIDRLADLAGYMEDHNNAEAKLIVTFGGLILALLAAVVVIFEVSPPGTDDLKVETTGSGEARISTDEVAQRLEEEIRALPQIRQVQASVLARGRRAELNLDLHVTAEADLAATTDEACRLARQLVEERMGVPLTRPPRAQLHYRELQVARSQQELPPPAPPAQQGPSPAPVIHPPMSTESTHDAPETSHEDRPAGA